MIAPDDAAVSSDEPEKLVWKGRPSQIVNLGPFTVAVVLDALSVVAAFFFWPLFFLGFLPIGWAAWKFAVVHCRVYELTTERLRLFEGVFNQQIDEVELYRVKDTRLERPFWQRVFGLATLILETSDRSHPRIDIRAIRDGAEVREHVRKFVEAMRDKKRVREVDFEGEDDGEIDLG
ncbi:MAG: PH domain-containing protein [Akkermansiaceae bacterium]|nr:PH domain-containing protein [Akkermansiaceae bacterium]NNM29773.1 PH domain-containing protein [Akkermansiaceae bacterium]